MKKLFIIFAVLCLAAPAMAADWNFYGSARMATFRVDVDPDIDGVDSDTDTQWAQQGNSRIGATVKFNDEIGGGFEMSDSFGKRKLYGTYNFGSGQLLLGQTYTPSAIFASNSVYDGDGDLLGIGEFYEGRLPMIQLTFGGLKIALITPATAGPTNDLDTTLPKLEAAYKYSADMFSVQAFAGYNSTTDEGTAIGDVDYDSYVAGIGVGLNFGPVFVNLGAHMGQNLGNYGAYQPYLDDEAAIVGGELKDNDGLGYLAVIGFKASDMFTIEAGYGHEETELDDSNNTEEADQYYLNATINITKGFFIVPEIGMQKYSDDASSNEPEVFYYGAKWQINF
jgi:hypothetical protein